MWRNFANTSPPSQQPLWPTKSQSKTSFRRKFKIYLSFICLQIEQTCQAPKVSTSRECGVYSKGNWNPPALLCLQPSASCPDGPTKGEQEATPGGPDGAETRAGGWLVTQSRAQAWGHCTKAGLWPGKAVKGGSSPTTRDTTKASNIIPEFYTEIGDSSLSKANISDSDKSKEKDKNKTNHH